jgi:uncharacterized protein Yka (UPF0111/DUF47 family)
MAQTIRQQLRANAVALISLAEQLREVWQANWQQIHDDEPSVDRITAEIDQTRETIRKIVHQLR